jgi:hypothetical protein
MDAFVSKVNNADYTYLNELKDEIVHKLCCCVPNRKDIHEMIKQQTEILDDTTISTICTWVKRFHSPVYDYKIDEFKALSHGEFVFAINEHIDQMLKEIKETKEKIKNGIPLYTPESSNGIIPDVMKTG